MCGICGTLRLDERAPALDPGSLRRMRDSLAARGPDGEGEWTSGDGRLALGHRRLAILDLSPAGAQPMADPTGRYRIVFNGEIYNFRVLRQELERAGVAFSTQSDTEVLLALWAREGERALARLRGMYAFAIWDEVEKSLTLTRDPFGIKPLYWEIGDSNRFRFASQVRALEAAGASRQVDPAGLVGFLLWGSVPEPWTIRRSIRALPAGHLLTVRDGVVGEPRPAARPAPPPDDRASVTEALEASVEAHLVSDVPVALFLSAGLDSALVAALAAKRLGDQLATFTLAFEGWEGSGRDEAPLARKVAESLGTRHLERKLTRTDIEAAWQPALAAMDQPSIDGFNTFLVARAAHEAGIKVALSGLGGDELFGSYPSFSDVPSWMRKAKALRRGPGLGALVSALSPWWAKGRPKARGLVRYGGTLAGAYFLRRGLFLPEELPALIGRDLAAEGLATFDPVAHTQRTLDAPGLSFYGAFSSSSSSSSPGASDASLPASDDWLQVQRLEASLYMRNQLLRDSDWASMASSLELRVPLVDPILWAQVARHGHEPARSQGKAAVVRAAAPDLPSELWSRPKSGFTIPVAEWICPPRAGERDTMGKGSRRLAQRILEEMQLCPAR